MPENILKFYKENADFFVPDNNSNEDALSRITHLGVGAHPDDLEIMAADGILRCFNSSDSWFGGITCTSGSGSPRSGKYADYTTAEMAQIRCEEQRTAAKIGCYGAMIQLGFESSEICGKQQDQLENDLFCVFNHCHPEVVYTHNPADKHPTHLAVFWATLKAIRRLPRDRRPRCFYGCEVWRDLDWMPDSSKVFFDISKNESLMLKLINVYDSQIAGGKNYVEGIVGRWKANATFNDPYNIDQATRLSIAMNLAPLIEDDKIEIVSYVTEFIKEFNTEVMLNIEKINTANK